MHLRAKLLLAVMPVVLISATGATSTAAEAPPMVTIDFENAEPGRTPAGFFTALTGGAGPVSWIVREDASAPSGSKVLVQTSADSTGYRFPLCIYDGLSAADVTISVKFKPIAGKADQAAGIVWRYQDQNNYYIVRANALENNVVLYKVENGKRSDLKPVGAGVFTYGKKTEVANGRWQELGVVAHGSRFEVSLDGAHLFDVEDATFQKPGRVGLWTKADSVTAFDDLKIATSGVGANP